MKLKEITNILSDHVPMLLYMHTPFTEHDNEYMWNGYSHRIPDSWLEHEVIHISHITWQRRKTIYIDLQA